MIILLNEPQLPLANLGIFYTSRVLGKKNVFYARWRRSLSLLFLLGFLQSYWNGKFCYTDILLKFANEWGIATPFTILCIVKIKLTEKIVPFYVSSLKKKSSSLTSLLSWENLSSPFQIKPLEWCLLEQSLRVYWKS